MDRIINTRHNNRIKQMPQQLSAIDNAGSNFCVLSVKAGEGHLLYSTDVTFNKNEQSVTSRIERKVEVALDRVTV